jgi:hypothetical protein
MSPKFHKSPGMRNRERERERENFPPRVCLGKIAAPSVIDVGKERDSPKRRYYRRFIVGSPFKNSQHTAEEM